MVLGQILHLNDAACPAPCAVGSVKLEHPSCPAIGADGGLHRLILFHAGFRKLLAQGQHLLQLWRRGFQKLRHCFFTQGIGLHAVIRKPLFHLLYRVGIVQRGQFLHCLCQLRAGAPVHLNGLPHQFHIQPHAAVVDLLVEMVFLPHAVRHGIFGEPCLDGHLRLHIADVVSFERQPLVRRVFGKVAGTLTIGLGWRTGLAEIFNEVFALRQLLFFQSQHSAGSLQG